MGKKDKNIFKAIFIIGAPASGKTELYSSILQDKNLKHIDPDKIMTFYVKRDSGDIKRISNYDEYKNKIEKTAKKATDTYLMGRLGLVVDGTGRNYSLISGLKRKLENTGYQTMMIHVDTSIDKSIEKAKERERPVSKEFIASSKKQIDRNIEKYRKIFNNFISISSKEYNKAEKEVNKFLNKSLTQKAKQWISESLLEQVVNEILSNK